MLYTVHNIIHIESKTTSDRKCHTDAVSKIMQVNKNFIKKINHFITNTMSLDTNKVHI